MLADSSAFSDPSVAGLLPLADSPWGPINLILFRSAAMDTDRERVFAALCADASRVGLSLLNISGTSLAFGSPETGLASATFFVVSHYPLGLGDDDGYFTPESVADRNL